VALTAQLLTIEPHGTVPSRRPLLLCVLEALVWVGISTAALHVSYTWEFARPLVAIYIFGLIQLACQERWRLAFYPGMLVGILTGVLHLRFFFVLFSYGAIGLWFVLGFWVGLFVALARLALRRFGPQWGLVALPFLWTGLEYFRSELYYLRFSWLTPGLAFSDPVWLDGFHVLGVFGIGLVVASMVCCALAFKRPLWRGAILGVFLVLLSLLPRLPGRYSPAGGRYVHVAGVQMEFPAENEVLVRLRELIRKFPETELVVLSEYTFDGPVPQSVLNWCATNRVHMIVGGKEPTKGTNFYNMAFVINPDGQIVSRQPKAVPIQFMTDGVPAERMEAWNSPWGKMGICICYDLSYTRVTDALVRQGAEALIVPTMDVIDWGEHQHELHGRIAPARASEYGLPIFRVASSGISQNVDATGQILSSAPTGAEGAIIGGRVLLRGPGRLPLDRWIAPISVAVTGTMVLFIGFERLLGRRRRH
jgi:apolipoprotein N-acyltransferase